LEGLSAEEIFEVLTPEQRATLLRKLQATAASSGPP
jgi:hypothetical protein